METQDFNQLRSRPRFKQELSFSAQELINKFQLALSNNQMVVGSIATHLIFIQIPSDQRHVWSPQLHLIVEELDPDNSVLRGLYGPSPAVWTLFVFLYAGLSLCILGATFPGLAHMTIGKDLWVSWLIPLGFHGLLGTYLLSLPGRKLGEKQMIILRQFYEDTIHSFSSTTS